MSEVTKFHPDGTTSTTQRRHISRRAWRMLDKRPRAPARAKSWAPDGQKLTEANLSLYEAELGIAAVAYESGFRVGRVLGYDAQKNVFTVVGTRVRDRKPIEARIAGFRVSTAVIAARTMLGVPVLARPMSGR